MATYEAELVDAPGIDLVRGHCGVCHSLRLVTQNRGDREHWLKTIRWMQQTQNFWVLEPATEDQILNYLSTHFGPVATGRRAPLHPSLLPPRVFDAGPTSVIAKFGSTTYRNTNTNSASGCQCGFQPHADEQPVSPFLVLVLGLLVLRMRCRKRT